MINIPKKIADDMQKELNKLNIKFDVQYMSARVNSLDTVITRFDQGKKRLAKQKQDYNGAMIISPNLSNVYSKPTTRTYDGNFNIMFAIDHSKMNETLDAINEFAFNINGLYLVDLKDNKYKNGSLRDSKGLRRKYKASVGIEGGTMNGAEGLYQTYTLTIGVHISNQIMGDDYRFTLVEAENQNNSILINELVRTDLGGDNIETTTEESNDYFGTLVTGSKEQYTFTKLIDFEDPLINILLDIKTKYEDRIKYVLKKEVFGVNNENQYVALRTDLYSGVITNPTCEFDKGREAIISFYFEANNNFAFEEIDTQLPEEEGDS